MRNIVVNGAKRQKGYRGNLSPCSWELKSRHQTTAGAGEQGWVKAVESPEAHFPFRGPEGEYQKCVWQV